MIHTLSQTTKQIIFLTVIIFGLLAYSFMNASWTEPPASPPNNNTGAPINVGADYQAKFGDLGAVRMRAGEYCNADGSICSDPSTSVNASCATLPVCGSVEDIDKFKDCRVSEGTAYFEGGPLCVTRVNVTPTMTWGEASQVCNTVYGSGYRLPVETELLSIYNQKEQIGNIIKGQKPDGTSLITPWAYWSAKYTDSNDGRMQFIYMNNGNLSGQYGTRQSNVRCVKVNIGHI